MVEKLKVSARGDWRVLVLYQPISPLLAKHSVDKDGNVLGLDRCGELICMCNMFSREDTMPFSITP
jgi:hypothetical protein